MHVTSTRVSHDKTTLCARMTKPSKGYAPSVVWPETTAVSALEAADVLHCYRLAARSTPNWLLWVSWCIGLCCFLCCTTNRRSTSCFLFCRICPCCCCTGCWQLWGQLCRHAACERHQHRVFPCTCTYPNTPQLNSHHHHHCPLGMHTPQPPTTCNHTPSPSVRDPLR